MTAPVDSGDHVEAAEHPPVELGDLGRRISGLTAMTASARGRVDDDVLAPADRLIERGSERLRLSGEHTIVSLAGATGSGKSSLFNALTDLELAGTGVRRPTTSWALACAWGPDGAEKLLEWMGIPARHQVSRMSMLDRSTEDTKLDGLILLDLPDHDSTEVAHHLEMERLVPFSDMLVWVLDPQKYADAAIHERYIRPMAAYSDVTLVVLNQIDRIPHEQRQRALDDVQRLIDEDGLTGVTVLGVSATRGDGLDDLKREVASRIRAKSAAKSRLITDVTAAAEGIADVAGSAPVPVITPDVRQRLADELADCAGVQQFAAAVGTSTRRRARQRTSWPVTRWISRGGSSGAEELGLGEEFSSKATARLVAPEIGPVQRASAELVVREVVDDVTAALGRPWRTSIRAAVDQEVADALDASLGGTDLGFSTTPVWWRLVQVIQWLLLLAAVGAAVWWGVERVEIAAWIAGGSLLAGLALGLLSRLLARWSGRRRAAKADAALRASVQRVAEESVLQPVEAALAEYGSYHAGLRTALD